MWYCYTLAIKEVHVVLICYRNNGTVVFEDTVPDTITSWIATAFAVHPETGLGISESSAKVTLLMIIPYIVYHFSLHDL